MQIGRKSRVALAAAALLVAAGSAMAVVILIPAGGPTIVAPPPSGLFGLGVTINQRSVANGGYGDQILTVEEGRDVQSPFCQISVLINPANPAWNTLIGAAGSPYTTPQFWPLQTIANFYPPNAQGPIGTIPNNPPIPALMILTYRSTNDPENPGWPGPPALAAVGQLESNIQACHYVAEAFAALRTRVPPGNAPAAAWAEIHIDPNPANPTFLEFWKYHIVR